MAEFGIKSTELSAPTGAGSTPIAGVVGAADAVVDTTLPSGLLGVGAQLASDYGKSLKVKEQSPILSALSQDLTNLSQAVDSGGISAVRASTEARARLTKALGAASGNVELTKAINDHGKTWFGITNLGTANEAADREAAFDTMIKTELAKDGYPVDPNPTPEQMQAYRTAFQTSRSSQKEFSDKQSALDYQSKLTNFTTDQKKLAIKNNVDEFVAKNLPATTDALNATTTAAKTAISMGQAPEEAMRTIDTAVEYFKDQLLQLQPGSPEYVSSVVSYLDRKKTLLRSALDPKVTAESLEAMLKTEKLSDQLMLRTNGNIRAFDAIQSISPNNAFIHYGMSTELLAAITPMVMSFDPNKKGGENINWKPSQLKKEAYGSVRESIKAVTAEMNKPNGEKIQGPTHLNNMVNNLLSQAGQLSGDPTVRASDAQDFVGFLASDEFKAWRQNGQLSPDALAGAQEMFSTTYLKTVQVPIINKLQQTVTQAGQSSSLIIGSMQESPPDLRYIDIFDVQFDGSGINFVPRKIGGSDFVQASQANQYASELNSTKTIINQAIRAGANVSGTKDLKAYWESNKHNILPAYFAASTKGLKVGDVVNGKKYMGGSPNSKYSWRDDGTANQSR